MILVSTNGSTEVAKTPTRELPALSNEAKIKESPALSAMSDYFDEYDWDTTLFPKAAEKALEEMDGI